MPKAARGARREHRISGNAARAMVGTRGGSVVVSCRRKGKIGKSEGKWAYMGTCCLQWQVYKMERKSRDA